MKGIKAPRLRDSNRDRGHNKNNFRDQAVKDKCKYRLWVKVKAEFAVQLKAMWNGKHWFIVRYGYSTKPDGGWKYLVNLVDTIGGMYHVAIIYNNQDPECKGLKKWQSD